MNKLLVVMGLLLASTFSFSGENKAAAKTAAPVDEHHAAASADHAATSEEGAAHAKKAMAAKKKKPAPTEAAETAPEHKAEATAPAAKKH